jgi:hypothetical protein
VAKTKRRSRNIARKPKSRPFGFVPQTSEPPSNLAASSAPQPASGFVPQSAAAERRREELHQLRLAQAQLRIQRDQAKLDREQAREETRAAREAAKATAQQSKTENTTLLDALEHYLNTMPNAFDTPGFVPQNPATTDELM